MELSTQSNIDLPDRCAVEQCAVDFYTSFQRCVFPVIDLSLFKATIELAYSQSITEARSEQVAARCCVLSLLCTASLFELNDKVYSEYSIDSCVKKIQPFYHLFISRPTIDGLQTLIFLVSNCHFPFHIHDITNRHVTEHTAVPIKLLLGQS